MKMDLTRRESLAFGATLLGGAAAQAAGVRGAESLNQDAKRKGRRFGSAVGLGWPGRIGGAFADPNYRRIVAAESGPIVPENELKWGWLRGRPTGFDFSGADRLLAWAESHGLAMRGHNLVW